MIELVGEDFSIKIQENNSIYKTLSRFIGENVTIKAEALKDDLVPLHPRVDIPKVFESIDREFVFKEFFENFAWSNLDEKEQPLTFKLLHNHLKQVLGSDSGMKNLEKIDEGVYKSGELYLVRL